MKKLIFILLIFILISKNIYAVNTEDLLKEQTEVSGFDDTIKVYSENNADIISELQNPNSLIDNMVKGNEVLDSKNIFNNILNYMFKELKVNISLIVKIIIIAVLCGILKNLQSNFNGSTSEVGFYVCFIVMITLLVVGFKDILIVGQEAVTNMVNFMQIVIPSLLILIASSGSMTASVTLYPTLLLFVQVMSSIFNFVLLPLVSFYGVCGIISNISEKKEFNKLGGFIKTITIWVLGIVGTVFVTIITAQSTITGTVDGVVSKTAKFAFSSAVPIVGKTLSDAVETVMGCSMVIKNATGWVSIIIIFGIVLSPLIKIVVMILIYRFASVLVELISDSRLSNCLNDLADTLTLLFAILVSISFIFIIAITILLKTVDITTMVR